MKVSFYGIRHTYGFEVNQSVKQVSFRSDFKHIHLFNFIGGPAESAGLKPGDCILEINGINVRYESFCHLFYDSIQITLS